MTVLVLPSITEISPGTKLATYILFVRGFTAMPMCSESWHWLQREIVVIKVEVTSSITKTMDELDSAAYVTSVTGFTATESQLTGMVDNTSLVLPSMTSRPELAQVYTLSVLGSTAISAALGTAKFDVTVFVEPSITEIPSWKSAAYILFVVGFTAILDGLLGVVDITRTRESAYACRKTEPAAKSITARSTIHAALKHCFLSNTQLVL